VIQLEYNIIHVSDPHILAQELANDVFYERVAEEVNEISHSNTIFINTGDIFDQWSEVYNDSLSEVLENVKTKNNIYIPGNHDVSYFGTEKFSEFDLFVEGIGTNTIRRNQITLGYEKRIIFPIICDFNGLIVVGFDTTIPNEGGGRFSLNQLSIVANNLAKYDSDIKMVLLAAHHGPISSYQYSEKSEVDNDAILRYFIQDPFQVRKYAFQKAALKKNVEEKFWKYLNINSLFIGGHFHIPEAYSLLRAFPTSNKEGFRFETPILNAGAAANSKKIIRYFVPSFNEYSIDEKGIKAALYIYIIEEDRFRRLDFAQWNSVVKEHPEFGQISSLEAQYIYNYYDIFDEQIASVSEL
jgi:3',5'-cyclic AMP phosphodiesterase CpdA